MVEAVADMHLPKNSHHLCRGRAASCAGEVGEVAYAFVKVRSHWQPAMTEEVRLSVDAWMEGDKLDMGGTRVEHGGQEDHWQKQI